MITLKNYEITQTLRQGKNYDIFRAIHIEDKQSVIIKTHANCIPSTKDYYALRREFKMGEVVNHPNVIKYYALEKVEHRLALVMEDFNGEALTKLIPQTGFTLNEFLNMAVQLTKAIGGIHEQQIIHQAISAENILLNPNNHHIKITNFTSASRWVYERQLPVACEKLSLFKLDYISPEQTGRMNRTIDYRTDFYSLGVVLYQMLCGHLPFIAKNALELIHCHIAKAPVFPYGKKTDVPHVVFSIIEKLLAKNAEDRYQSAYGLEADLQECLNQLNTTGTIKNFNIGKEDKFNRFSIHQKVYGREAEILQIFNIFNEVSEGKSNNAFLVVHGYSGVGKTSLINEIQKPIMQAKANFIAGKCDQFDRNVPYAAFIQAFSQLIRQIVMGSEASIDEWKAKLSAALGPNGQIIIDVIPELEIIIGAQPPVVELSPIENQNRFQHVFLNFIATFSQEKNPLIIFLDDLQWVNMSVLNMIKLIILNPDTRNLFLIGAYRDNEVDENHPLSKMLEDVRKQKMIHEIALKPLSLIHINRLVADTLHNLPVAAEPLANLVYEKTQGNPFFTNQFLTLLYQTKLIEFNATTKQWKWNPQEIKALAVTDNVVDLMVSKIRQLPEITQTVLSLAASIGYQFDLDILAIVSESSLVNTSKVLWSAVQAGLILPLGKKFYESTGENQQFQFLHDRVQQAAASFILPDHFKPLQLKIGRLLLDNTPSEKLDEKLFYIVGQLNAASELIIDEKEKINVAKLNLKLAKKSKDTTAYASAINHAQAGINLLPEERWETYYDLTLALYKQLAESYFLEGRFVEAEKLYPVMLTAARSNADKISIYFIKMNQMELQGRYSDAINAMRDGLALCDIYLPDNNMQLHAMLQEELRNISSNLGRRSIKNLIKSPEIIDPKVLTMMNLLYGLWTPCYTAGLHQYSMLVSAMMVNLSLRYGNCEFASVAYTGYSVYAGLLTGDYGQAYEFGKVGIKLSQQYNNLSLRCKAYLMFGGGTCFWRKPLKNSYDYLDHCYELGIESGNLAGSGYAVHFMLFYRFMQGEELTAIQELSTNYWSFLKRTNLAMYEFTMALTQPIRDLLGLPEHLNEEQYLANYSKMLVFEGAYYAGKIITAYLLEEDIKKCLDYASKALEIVPAGLKGLFEIVETEFYAALIYLLAYETANTDEQQQYLGKVETIQSHMQIWMNNCTANCSHKFFLIEAEKARVLKRAMDDTLVLYDQAIAAARHYEFIQYEALGNELFAKYWLKKNKEEIASIYLQKAYHLYSLWGAKVKIGQLENSYPQLRLSYGFSLEKMSPQTDTPLFELPTSNLYPLKNLAQSKKSTQANPGEVNLGDLLVTMLQLIMECANAQKGAFILNHEGRLTVEAECNTDLGPINTLQGLQLESWENGPKSIVQFVKRTKQYAISGNATTDDQFSTDPYIIKNQIKSILCMPVMKQEEVRGLLYLENNLIADAFTSRHIEVLNILASQIAVSLENAILYESMRSITERLNHALKGASMGTWCWSVDNKLSWDEHMFELYGLKREEFGNKYESFIAMVHPEDRAIVERSVKRALEEGTPHDVQLRIIRQNDKSVRTLVSRANVYRDNQGQIKGMIGACCDITHVKELEEERFQAMKQANEKARQRDLALTAGNIGTWVWNLQTNEMIMDDRALTLFGVQRKDFKSTFESFLALCHPDDRIRIQQAIQQTIENNVPYDIEFRVTKADDNSIHILAGRAEVYYNAQGQAENISGVYWDITQRKRLEDERLLTTVLKASEAIQAQTLFDQLTLLGKDWEAVKHELVTGVSKYGSKKKEIALANMSALVEYRDILDYGIYRRALEIIFPSTHYEIKTQLEESVDITQEGSYQFKSVGYKFIVYNQVDTSARARCEIKIEAPGSRALTSDIDTSIYVTGADQLDLTYASSSIRDRGPDINGRVRNQVIANFYHLNEELHHMTSSESHDSNVYMDAITASETEYPKFNFTANNYPVIDGNPVIQDLQFYAQYKLEKHHNEQAASIIVLRRALTIDEWQAFKNDIINQLQSILKNIYNDNRQEDYFNRINEDTNQIFNLTEELLQESEEILNNKISMLRNERADYWASSPLCNSPDRLAIDMKISAKNLLYVDYLEKLTDANNEVIKLRQQQQELVAHLEWLQQQHNQIQQEIASLSTEDYREKCKDLLLIANQSNNILTQRTETIKAELIDILKQKANKMLEKQILQIKANLFAHGAYVSRSALYHVIKGIFMKKRKLVLSKQTVVCSALQHIGFRLLHANELRNELKSEDEIAYYCAKYGERVFDLMFNNGENLIREIPCTDEQIEVLVEGTQGNTLKILDRLKVSELQLHRFFTREECHLINSEMKIITQLKKATNIQEQDKFKKALELLKDRMHLINAASYPDKGKIASKDIKEFTQNKDRQLYKSVAIKFLVLTYISKLELNEGQLWGKVKDSKRPFLYSNVHRKDENKEELNYKSSQGITKPTLRLTLEDTASQETINPILKLLR